MKMTQLQNTRQHC